MTPHTPAGPVRAAGCVLWRRAPSGDGIELALVHRPKYGDWSWPKGKLNRAEREDARCGERRAARREVREETGMECELGAPLPTMRYLAQGRPKVVSYWAAEATDGEFAVNREVDRLLWLSPRDARRHLTYDHDRPLVDALLNTLHQVCD
ncbi:NUDIX domain-containing protein [Streptomyces sp. SB3404]|uniref:NUDIX domain-containing protein n=1 Tax=Streptomyces boncukensis TaxID=2711219 RepID=A0A6G4X2L4_9ACTN|nr:NUDIX domain-containing protein [Streptomyces boncukensis]